MSAIAHTPKHLFSSVHSSNMYTDVQRFFNSLATIRHTLQYRHSADERMISVCDVYLLDCLLTHWLTGLHPSRHNIFLLALRKSTVWRLQRNAHTTLKMKQQHKCCFSSANTRREKYEKKAQQNA